MAEAAIELCKHCGSPDQCRRDGRATCPERPPAEAPPAPPAPPVEVASKPVESEQPAPVPDAPPVPTPKGSDYSEIASLYREVTAAPPPSSIQKVAEQAVQLVEQADIDWLADPATLARSVGTLSLDDGLSLFDNHFYIINDKGGSAVVRQYGEKRLLKTFPKFREAFDRIKVMVMQKDKHGNEQATPVPAASLWLGSDRSPRYQYEDYYPVGINEVAPDHEAQRIKNMWRGFKPRKVSNLDITTKMSEACPLIFEYLWTVVASKRPEVMKYLVKWIADAIQNPSRAAGRTAIVLRSSDERTGKTTFIELLVAIFGTEHSYPAARMKDFSGNFSGQFEGISIVGCNEFFAMSTTGRDAVTAEATRSSIFDLIDNQFATIEPKGIGSYVVANFMRFVFTTNKAAAMPQGSQGTRFAVFDVSNCRRNDKVFFGKLHDVFNRVDGDGGELDRFITILASVPLADFHPQADKPQTIETERQAELAASGSKKWLMDLLDRGEMIIAARGEQFGNAPTYLVTAKAVQRLMEEQHGHRGLGMSQTAFGREVMNVLAIDGAKDIWVPQLKASRAGRRIPELTLARKLFEERANNGMKIDWSNGQTTWSEVSPTV